MAIGKADGMVYQFYPPVRQLAYQDGICMANMLGQAQCGLPMGEKALEALPVAYRPTMGLPQGRPRYVRGQETTLDKVAQPQGYVLAIRPDGITLVAADEAGLRYGLDTLAQVVAQSGGEPLRCLTIHDAPAVPCRGLMLDISRGKVYTREYLLWLADLLGRMRYNVLQLYVEHTFDFTKHLEICQGSDPLTAQDVLALQARCCENGITLQANLQSLGHCRRLLTRPQNMALAETDMYWSLCTTSPDTLQLLDELYAEYLPLFDSEWLNICADEPYDIGQGQSARAGVDKEELYLAYLLKVHALAARYGKRLMIFGDVFKMHPALIKRMPNDVVYLDWMYDPKPSYGTPALFHANDVPYWVCPGTGNWNTLFPRMDGAITNIVNLTLEGIAHNTQGMLLTDWNDHGGYTQPAPGYLLYAYAAAVAWCGQDPGSAQAAAFADRALALPGYAALVQKIAAIYRVVPIWSKNRSECVMALFDEPIFGQAVRGPVAPDTVKAYELALPDGIAPVLERHSQHPMRPYFSITPAACQTIAEICLQAQPLLDQVAEGVVKRQLAYILDAFALMLDKLALSRRIIALFASGQVDTPALVALEDALRVLVAHFVRLQLTYTQLWLALAKPSEIEISITYFAQVIARLDYLRDWLSLQRERIAHGQAVDDQFATYQTAGYGTLPTY